MTVKRILMWQDFSKIIEDHLETYTIPQYGDYPDDQMTTASLDDIKHNMQRYLNRMGTNARGQKEALRDMLKMAHYSQMAYFKMLDAEQAYDDDQTIADLRKELEID